jgi:hypothetical protein
VSRYPFVGSQRLRCPVAAACQAAGVATSAYYAWKTREQAGRSEPEQAEGALLAEMHAIHV